ncbi:MAG: RNase adapter RapZ [Actinobacteria bacterium]|nr:RNase adapter RapZ [Actinomycetota bacterium]NBY15720.1 RNase adapter RapZ [Actinomycetota bacterium]
MTSSELEVLLVTGMSGAGRSTATKALQDLGWYTVDNIPAPLLVQVSQAIAELDQVSKIAISVDVRSARQLDELNAALAELADSGVTLRILFLKASDEIVVRRYESSRRPHPMQREQNLLDAVSAQRELLAPLRGQADLIIDTSNLNVHELRRAIENAFGDESSLALRISVLSFGFKYGIPVDADLVADMRFLPNPFWEESLREQSGLDVAVSDYVMGQPETEKFLNNYLGLIELVREGYLREGKRFVTIAIGCTGGKHRSVAIAEELVKRLVESNIETRVVHRDLGRE